VNIQFKNKSVLWLAFVIGAFVLAATLHGSLNIHDTFVLLGLCFACELVDSGLGMGYGTILTPTLLLIGYEPQDIVPTVLLSELLSGSTAAYFHNEIKNVDLSLRGKDILSAATLAAGSLAGVTAGVFVAVNISKDTLAILIGCIILLSGFFVVLLSRKAIEYRRWKMLLLSAIASFNKAVSGGGYGPLVTSGQILSGVQGKASVGITSFAEAFTCLFAVTLFLIKGGHLNLDLFIPMCAGALSSVPFSVFAINKAKEDHLKIVIGVMTMAMGGLTIWKAMN
jgi:uncharacterized membrane protein YfcA